jgi:PAS domain S-box-containing protein
VAFEATWESDIGTGEMSWDAGLEKMFGYLPGEVIGTISWWRERVHPDDLERVERTAQEALQNSESSVWSNEYRFRRKDGSWAWVASRCAFERDAQGRPVRAVGAMSDISKLKETESRLRQVLDTLPVGVVVIDKAGDIFLANPASSRIWGGVIASAKERYPRSKGAWHDTGKALQPEEWASARALNAGQTSLNELIDIETFDGRRTTISNSAAPIRNERQEIVGAVVVNEDVSERVRAEKTLRRTQRLQSAIAQLTLTALSGDDIQPLFEVAVAEVAKILEVDHAMVVEALPDQSGVRFRATAGPWKPDLIGETCKSAPGFMSWFSLRAGAPVVVADLPAETRFIPCEVLLAHGLKSGINVPIPGRKKPFGVLGAHSTTKRSFSEDEINFVWSVANVLATCIERSRTATELAEKRAHLQTLSRKLIEAQEAERSAVARELHDDFGQVLTALKFNLQRRESDEADSIALVDGAIARMRDLAQDLRPPLLDELGLESSLRSYMERETGRAGIQFQPKIAGLQRRPPLAVETACFRVAQEALTNVIRHSRARNVEVELDVVGNALQLVVRDDGQGFDVVAARKRAARGESQGLISMQERISLAGGELEIDSGPGRGSAVRARFPLAEGARS